ncbi:MAG: DUF2085 domain-containing protein [Anaerosomatales bacterium]|nr:DUF2085 domain-containing protein [Anaerosomatales bacterium]
MGSNPAIPTIEDRTAGFARSLPSLFSRQGAEVLDPFLHWLGYGLCHQLPGRSFFAGGVQLPVCARDTGIYAGFAMSLLVIAMLEKSRRPTRLPAPWLMVLGGAGVVAMAVDGVTSYAGIRETTNAVRLATGLAAGWALPLVVVPMLNGQMWRRMDDAPLLSARRGLWWLAGLVASYAVLYWVMPETGLVYPLSVAGAIIVTLTAVNLVFVTLAPPFERAADGLRAAWRQLALAGLLTVAELLLAGWLRAWLERIAS